ncbi:MAG TPA: cyclase family protein [Solirubrobacteraceae bacterium]|nr:cyclase family protein [Solirubrobacteraceae bacterium]
MCLPGTVAAVREAIDAEGVSAAGIVSRRTVLAGSAVAALAALVPTGAAARQPRRRGARRYQDLTHVFRGGFPVYSGDAPARRTLVTVADDGFYSQQWTFGEHSGTHMDAPGHFVADGRLVPQLRPAELFAPAAVIDISSRAARDPDAMVEPSDLRRFERRHGQIPRGAIVFMYSGWERRLGDPTAFKNVGSDGKFHFPGFGREALDVLLRTRRITGIGVDTLSLDIGASSTFDVHKRLLGADRYGLENVANLSKIPPRGANVVVGVIPWEDGSGGPCRLIATY